MTGTVWDTDQVSVIQYEGTLSSQLFTATADQQVFTITEFQYTVGSGMLEVYVTGILQENITELSETSFSLAEAVPAGTTVYAKAFVGSENTLSTATAAAQVDANLNLVQQLAAQVSADKDIAVDAGYNPAVQAVGADLSGLWNDGYVLNPGRITMSTVGETTLDGSSYITTLGNNIADLQALAVIIADITTVAGSAASVTAVSSIAADTTTVAGIVPDVTTVAAVSSDVTAVAAISSDVVAAPGAATAAQAAQTAAETARDAAAVSEVNAATSATDWTNAKANGINTAGYMHAGDPPAAYDSVAYHVFGDPSVIDGGRFFTIQYTTADEVVLYAGNDDTGATPPIMAFASSAGHSFRVNGMLLLGDNSSGVFTKSKTSIGNDTFDSTCDHRIVRPNYPGNVELQFSWANGDRMFAIANNPGIGYRDIDFNGRTVRIGGGDGTSYSTRVNVGEDVTFNCAVTNPSQPLFISRLITGITSGVNNDFVPVRAGSGLVTNQGSWTFDETGLGYKFVVPATAPVGVYEFSLSGTFQLLSGTYAAVRLLKNGVEIDTFTVVSTIGESGLGPAGILVPGVAALDYFQWQLSTDGSVYMNNRGFASGKLVA